jgi:Domain of unknown function (DUF4149)
LSSGLARETTLRAVLWLSLGSWVGAWGFFAFVVSRIAFQVLPGNVAGDLAGSLLHILHLGGAGAALLSAAAMAGLGRRGLVVGVPVLLALASVASELVLSPEIAALRPSALGAGNTADTQARFGLLHGLSLGLFVLIHLASIGLVVWVAWLETRDRERALPRGH